jgi:hypothetical protein
MKDFVNLEAAVNGDAVDAFKLVGVDPRPINRRAATRAAFAYIETMVYLLRQNALLYSEDGHVKYTTAELAVLREENYRLADDGTVQVGERRYPLRGLVRFSVAMFARFFDPTFTLDKGNDWRLFCEALAIRERVTHPRKASDVDVTDADIATLFNAFRWFHGQMEVVFAGASKKMDAEIAALNAKKTELEAAKGTLDDSLASRGESPTT